MKQRRMPLAMLLMFAVFVIVPATAQEAEQSHRKLKLHAPPTYPEMAKNMNLSGTVRLQLTVKADGTVKDAKVLGGHPLLADAAQRAALKWRYEPGGEETAIVALEFKQ